ncbi:rod-binding protein [Thalassovita sp.]|uniref:rod-binding protein n=1 Tax=Thalassovita sp. TaxID=1979401 RepID=UPI002B27A36E|nr:rod-binding protein [Thalassovita sp.]
MVGPLTSNTVLPAIKTPDTTGNNTVEAAREMQRMRDSAEGFEALFLQQMLKAGRAASLGDDLLGSSGVDQMQSMLDTTLTESAGSQAGLGMADAIVRQFSPYMKHKADNA